MNPIAPPTDLLVKDGKLLVKAKDLVLGDATADLVQTLMLTRKGDMKWDASTGIGIYDYILTDEADLVQRLARAELIKDRFEIRALRIVGETIQIDGAYS